MITRLLQLPSAFMWQMLTRSGLRGLARYDWSHGKRAAMSG